MRRMRILPVIMLIFMIVSPLKLSYAADEDAVSEETADLDVQEETAGRKAIVPCILLSMGAAFTLNFVIVLIYSRERKSPDACEMSGNCRTFEIKNPEMERQL